jgi:uncharacterized membrane protein
VESIKADGRIFTFRLYLFLVCFSAAGHILTNQVRLDPGFIAPLASGATLLCGLVAAHWEYWQLGKTAWMRTGAVFVGGATVELIGLKTGFPFGHYAYTGQWMPWIFFPGIGIFPLLLPFAWVLVAGSSSLSSRWAIGAAALAAGLDLVMEGALAGKMGYWRWQSVGPLLGHSPWSNSVSWFVLSLVAALVMRRGVEEKLDWRIPLSVLAGQLVLMLCLTLA